MIFYQRKFCIDCGVAFHFESADEPNSAESCPLNPHHKTRDHVIKSKEGFDGFFITEENPLNTVETTWQDVKVIPLHPRQTTKYFIAFSCEVYNSANNAITCVRITVDGVEKILTNVDCEVDGGEKLERLVTGFFDMELNAKQHSIKVQFKCRSGTAYIRRLRVRGEPFCYSQGAGYGYGES